MMTLSWILAARALAFDLDPALRDPEELVDKDLPLTAAAQKLTTYPEQLIYDVGWGFIGVGQATLEARRLVDFGGRPAFEIESRAFSNTFCDTFYKVRDLNKSWIDAATLHSLGYLKRLREGSFFRDEWVLFDAAGGKFLARTTGRDGNFSVRTGTIPAQVHDILSSMYYVRTRQLEVGQDIVVDVNTKENWPLVVKVVKRERIKVPAGKFDTFLVEPMLRKEGLFIQKGKRLRIWLTADARKIPVLIKVEVFFGHITIELSEMPAQP